MDQKFSLPIHADADAYYMSTPEVVAQHIAERLSGYRAAVELCCAVGMTSIQLAKRVEHVYAIDFNTKRLADARHNARLYGVNNITFLRGDALDAELLKTMNADVAILDPDWSKAGDLDKSSHTADMQQTQPSLVEMMRLTRQYITSDIVARMPKTFTKEMLEVFGPCRVENISWDSKLRFKVVYYLRSIREYSETEVVF